MYQRKNDGETFAEWEVLLAFEYKLDEDGPVYIAGELLYPSDILRIMRPAIYKIKFNRFVDERFTIIPD